MNRAYNEATVELRKTKDAKKGEITFRMVNELAAKNLNVERDITDGSDPAKALKEKHAEQARAYRESHANKNVLKDMS